VGVIITVMGFKKTSKRLFIGIKEQLTVVSMKLYDTLE